MSTPPRLSELQQAFGMALAQDAVSTLEPWIAARGIEPAGRLRIYRHANYANHVSALTVSFPAVRAFLGDECFDGIATRHAARRGSHSGNLQNYGADFPAFLLQQDELAACPWVSDVAQLEWLRQQSALAAAGRPVDANTLIAAIVASDGDPQLRLHPHVRLYSASLPVLDLWRYAQDPDAADSAPDPAGPAQHVLLWRDGGQVGMCELLPAQAAFVRALLAGDGLEAAHVAAVACDANVAIDGLLRPLLENALVGWGEPAASPRMDARE